MDADVEKDPGRETRAEPLAESRGWWGEHWRPLVILGVLAGVILVLWWPRPKPTVRMPTFETTAKRTKPSSGPELEFNAMELSSVVQVLNWRGSVRYELLGEDLGGLLVTGTFRQNDVEGFIELLERELGVTGERGVDGVVFLKRKSKGAVGESFRGSEGK